MKEKKVQITTLTRQEELLPIFFINIPDEEGSDSGQSLELSLWEYAQIVKLLEYLEVDIEYSNKEV